MKLPLQLVILPFLTILLLAQPLELLSASRRPAHAAHGMVVSADSLASEAGLEILRKGGNAVDAAVAVGFCLAVTYPGAGNIGGGGFMLMRLRTGRSTVIDFREVAPGLASRNMYLDSAGNVVPGRSTEGALSSGVPGTVAGLLAALRSYGTMDREEVMSRAIELAEHGFHVDERLAHGIAEFLPKMSAFPGTMKIFTRDGIPLREGELLVQHDLARTLRSVLEKGEEGFYRGGVADRIVTEVNRTGGIISADDLAQYRAIERKPVTGSYRGYTVVSTPAPSAGGIILLEMLNMLERCDLKSEGFNSSATIHLFASAAQRAYADRAAYLGDPDFASIPQETLVSKSYAAERSAGIAGGSATPSNLIREGAIPRMEHRETTHYCVADDQGNVVCVTTTLNDSFGSKFVVDGAGFLLNDEMDDFVVKPGVPNMFGLTGGEANEIQPGKRMLSTMAPTIILKDGLPYVLLGASGGSRIATALVQIILNVIDFGMNIQEAVDAPRIHHQWLPDTLFYEHLGISCDVVENLQRMGYVAGETPDPVGKVQAILIEQERHVFYGASDPREGGAALGY